MKFEIMISLFKNNNNDAFVYNDISYSYGWIFSKIDLFDSFLKKNQISNKIIVQNLKFSPNSIALFLAILKNNNIVIPLYQTKKFEEQIILDISKPDFIIEVDDLESIILSKVKTVNQNYFMKKYLKNNFKGIVLFSSGTSGVPKGILHDFEKLIPQPKNNNKKLTTISFLLFDHIGGLNTLLFQMANLGNTILINSRNPELIGEIISKYKIELLPTTPSFLNLFLLGKIYEKYDLSSLKIISYGTEVMPENTLKKLTQIFPKVKFKQTYGLTEVGIISSKDKKDNDNWLMLNSDIAKYKVVNDILYIKTENSMLGYINAPSPFDEEGWFYTGDKVTLKDGYYKILGRETELINIGGQKVYPYEIENLILELPEIEEVLIYSESNFLLGSILIAKIKLSNCDKTNFEVKKLIQNYLKNKVADYKIPLKFEITKSSLINKRMKKIRIGDTI